RQRTRDRNDEGDYDRKTGTIDEDGGDHGVEPAGFVPIVPPSLGGLPSSAEGFMLAWSSALAGPGATAWPGRTFCRPSTMTLSPSESPVVTAAIVAVDCPSLIRRCSALLSGPSTKTYSPCWSDSTAERGIATTSTGSTPSSRTVTNAPSVSSWTVTPDAEGACRMGLAISPRTIIVSVFCAMVLSTKFSLTDWPYMRPSGS